ncbi:MAG TPA: CAP domain-containing protein [Candidatus Limnocylindrales bacterium]|nr:CAP domain-containing protein [Candidatus Limnocylindrales bacterium]
MSPTAAPPATKDKITTMEDEVTSLINKERAKAGCGAVKTDERMRAAGQAHSADMAKNNYFSHTGRDGSSFVDRLARAGYPKEGAAGENIAYGYSTAPAVVNGWMNSEGHRRNILNCSSKSTGVGLAYKGSTPYWTQLFGRI